ncbi:flocculation protein FLO11-like [Trifolium pratense]|uniref:flocculation protein FLO11-like n=1 Tax=Trifolium pratense TaxID=57577 RepID=UPI001E69497F|nr:flocculation protein FLO11-like [Trifolium pratense]
MTKTTEQNGTKNLPQQSSTSISNSNSTQSSGCCSSSSPLSSPNIQFQQQQCQKDSYFKNLTMKSQLKRIRNPLTDCTNTSSPVLFKNLSTNKASNPISSSSLSTPSPKKFPTPKTVDLEASGNISRAYSRRYSSTKRKDKEKEVGIHTSSVPSKTKDKDVVFPANREPIKFQQQCQKDPNSFENLTMESERKRKLTHRSPLSDCTNTSASSVPSKSTKYKSSDSSPVFKNHSAKSFSTINPVVVNLDDAANPNSSPSNFLSTPLPEKSSIREFMDLEDSEKKPIGYRRRYSSNKRKDEEKEMVIPTSSGVPFKRKDKGKDVVNLANSEPIKMKDKGKDTVFSGSSMFMDQSKEAGNSTSNKRKDIGEERDIPSSSTPILSVSNTREKTDGFERANPPKAKAFSAPCTKKDRVKSSKNGALVDVYPDLQDYVKEWNVYFKEIDDFEMLVEEVD